MTKSSQSGLQLVAIAILAGLVAAFHMGKVPAALPDIARDLELGLSRSGLIVSIFSFLAAVSGALMGVLSSRLGKVAAGTTGLIAVSLGALAGAVSDGYAVLLLSRVLEGFGFVLIAVTMPGLINALCPPQHKSLAMGIWGAFIPAAMCLMLLASPGLVNQYGWRGVWFLTAAISLIWLLVFSLGFRNLPPDSQTVETSTGGFRQLMCRTPLLVIGIFICYSALFASVTSFLPTFWTGSRNLSLQVAAHLSAVVVSGNIIGNILAGIATAKGVRMRWLFLGAFIVGGIAAAMVFRSQGPAWATACLGFLFTLFSGFIPGAVFANLPRFVANHATIPLMVGLIFQGAGIGQVSGPILLAYAVEQSGSWIAAGWVIAGLAGTGALLAYLLPKGREQIR